MTGILMVPVILGCEREQRGLEDFHGKRKGKDPWKGEDFCKIGISVYVTASDILEYYFIDLLSGQ